MYQKYKKRLGGFTDLLLTVFLRSFLANAQNFFPIFFYQGMSWDSNLIKKNTSRPYINIYQTAKHDYAG